MSTLTALYEAEQERISSEAAAQAEAVAAAYAAKVEAGLMRYGQFLANWAPLKGLLGLKGELTVNADRRRVEWDGTTAINNHPVITQTWLWLDSSQSDNLYINIVDAAGSGVAALGSLGAMQKGSEFPQILGRICSVWMENYNRHQVEVEEHAAKRQAALADATKWIGLARTYIERRRQWEVKCRRWASEWAVALWQPHELWRVRYVPVGSMLEDPDEDLIQSIVVMETPEDILTALQQFPTATVTKVGTAGDVVEMEIPSFLDAQKIEFSGFTINEAMAFHRHYPATHDVVVNVPPFEERAPEPAPGFVWWVAFVKECNLPALLGEIDPAVIAQTTPEQFMDRHWSLRYGYGYE
jgi:hypothetical protein